MSRCAGGRAEGRVSGGGGGGRAVGRADWAYVVEGDGHAHLQVPVYAGMGARIGAGASGGAAPLS